MDIKTHVFTDYVIRSQAIQCPECRLTFATPATFYMPELSRASVIEADLHRVLPFGALRAALVAVCPGCVFSWWLSAFEQFDADISTLKQAPEIDYPKKFAHAILSGRKGNAHYIDRALLALNGYWCARENAQPSEKWLTIAIQEFVTALNDRDWYGNRSRYYYQLGEAYRLAGDFKSATQLYDIVDAESGLPQELVVQQRKVALANMSCPIPLTREFIDAIFFSEQAEDDIWNDADLWNQAIETLMNQENAMKINPNKGSAQPRRGAVA